MNADKTIITMERAIEAGNSVLIENMGESIDAVYWPVITRSTFKKGRSLYVKMGDKEVGVLCGHDWSQLRIASGAFNVYLLLR